MTTSLPHVKAFERWVVALNRYGDLSATTAAVSDDVEVLRHGFGPERGLVVERIQGIDAVVRWLALTRDICRFELVSSTGAASADGEVTARYRITAEEFVGGGEWRAQLAPDGRIRRLQHLPDDLDPKWSMP
jgi:hypothetical protein